jgi:membrane associated rhomboid family serine protease
MKKRACKCKKRGNIMGKEIYFKDIKNKQLKALVWIGAVVVVAFVVLIASVILAAVGIVVMLPVSIIAGVAAIVSLVGFIVAGPIWLIVNRKKKNKE